MQNYKITCADFPLHEITHNVIIWDSNDVGNLMKL
jgi:hypothetical protein